jgi:hypothetical protein
LYHSNIFENVLEEKLVLSGYYLTDQNFEELNKNLRFNNIESEFPMVMEHTSLQIIEYSKLVHWTGHPSPEQSIEKISKYQKIEDNMALKYKPKIVSDFFVIFNEHDSSHSEKDFLELEMNLKEEFYDKNLLKEQYAFDGGASHYYFQWLLDVVDFLSKIDGTVGGLTALGGNHLYNKLQTYFKGEKIKVKLNINPVSLISNQIKNDFEQDGKIEQLNSYLREDGNFSSIFRATNDTNRVDYEILYSSKD